MTYVLNHRDTEDTEKSFSGSLNAAALCGLCASVVNL